MFIESLSFLGSTIGGSLVAGAGATAITGALSIIVASTPLGWAIIIVGGATVITASATASILANNAGKEYGNWIYDKITEWQAQ